MKHRERLKHFPRVYRAFHPATGVKVLCGYGLNGELVGMIPYSSNRQRWYGSASAKEYQVFDASLASVRK